MKEKILELLKNQGFIRYSKNTSWLIIEKIIRMTIGVFVGSWVARYLGPKNFGLLSYAQSFVAIFFGISTLGLDEIIIRELLKQKNKETLIGTTFILRLSGALLLLILVSFAVLFSSEDKYTSSLIFIIASSSIFHSFNIIDFYFQSEVKSKYIVLTNLISFGLSSSFKIYLILSKSPLIDFVWIIFLDSIVLALGYIYFFKIKSNLSFNKLSFKIKTGVFLLKESWPLIFNGMLVAIYMKIDQIMIKQILSETELGIYSAAIKISEVWYFVPVIISGSLFPAILNSYNTNIALYKSRIKALYFLMFWISISIGILIFLSSDNIISFMFGQQFIEASRILKIHVWSGVFVFLGVASSKWLITENLQKISMYNTAIGAIVNIVINFLLIKKIGVEGAAWATLVSYFIAAYLALLIWKKSRENFFLISKSIFYFKTNDFKSIF